MQIRMDEKINKRNAKEHKFTKAITNELTKRGRFLCQQLISQMQERTSIIW